MTPPALPRTLALAAALGLAAACGGASDARSRANLLVITLDTTRADRVSCYGYRRATTPHLDGLAATGHRFSAAETPMASTLPAHAALFTSVHPRALGATANGQPVPAAARTLAERLAERGVSTAAFVSGATLAPAFRIDQGFATYDAPKGDERPGSETREAAVAWLREHGGERFFCFVHLFDPHTWYRAPAETPDRFGAPFTPMPPVRGPRVTRERLTRDVCATASDAYDAEIRFADEQVGEILGELARLGLRDRTLVVVAGDHGETLDELLDARGYAYDHGEHLHRRELRVPLVLSVPPALGPAGPSVRGELVSLLDVMPTVLELLGEPADGDVFGRSLVPLLGGRPLAARPLVAERRTVVPRGGGAAPDPSASGAEAVAVTTPRWRFVLCEGREAELYDRSADPEERTNVASARADVVAALREHAERWRAAHADHPRRADGTVAPGLAEALGALPADPAGGL